MANGSTADGRRKLEKLWDSGLLIGLIHTPTRGIRDGSRSSRFSAVSSSTFLPATFGFRVGATRRTTHGLVELEGRAPTRSSFFLSSDFHSSAVVVDGRKIKYVKRVQKGRKMTRGGQNFVFSRAQFLFHLSAFALYVYVFCWHFTPEAAKLPQSGGFGWFYKLLTFCGFNFQLLALFVCLLSHVFPKSEGLKTLADDLSCSIFPIANAISILYWGILVITMKPVDVEVDGGVHRSVTHGLQSTVTAPWYINLSVHVFNSIITWIDISISERSFRKRAFVISYSFAVCYICWSQYVSSINKMYPYPFLNAMPQPQGYILVSLASLLILYMFSAIGSKVAGRSSVKFKAN